MNPTRIPDIEKDDVLICTLDFEADTFSIISKNKFEVKSTKSIKGKKWYPSVQLYYSNQGVTLFSD